MLGAIDIHTAPSSLAVSLPPGIPVKAIIADVVKVTFATVCNIKSYALLSPS
jgi:hypothetical protein